MVVNYECLMQVLLGPPSFFGIEEVLVLHRNPETVGTMTFNTLLKKFSVFINHWTIESSIKTLLIS